MFLLLFLLVLSFLHVLSAADEIEKGSSAWFVAINIIIPVLVVIAIAMHGLNRKPIRHRWFWKAVPFFYAALCLWDFIFHIPEIQMIVDMNPLSAFIVIAFLAIDFFAFYFSLQFGFSNQKVDSRTMPSQKIEAIKWPKYFTGLLFLIGATCATANLWIIVHGFYHAAKNSEVPYVYSLIFQGLPVVLLVPWVSGFGICAVGLLFAMAYRFYSKWIIPSFVMLVIPFALLVIYYGNKIFWITPHYP